MQQRKLKMLKDEDTRTHLIFNTIQFNIFPSLFTNNLYEYKFVLILW